MAGKEVHPVELGGSPTLLVVAAQGKDEVNVHGYHCREDSRHQGYI